MGRRFRAKEGELSYSNPELPEGINAEPHHPLKELVIAGGGALLLVGVVAISLLFFGRLIGPLIPFSWEVALANQTMDLVVDDKTLTAADSKNARLLQAMTDRLVPHMDLPPGMKITVHHVGTPTVNAMATLGGNVFVFKGLLDRVEDRNARAFVLAHEIAHVKHRHVIRSMTGGMMLSLLSIAISGDASGLSNLIGSGGLLAILHFSRAQEEEADLTALAAVAASYGDVRGFDKLFEVFSRLEAEKARPPEILRTHPLSADRIARLRRIARENGWLGGK